jgi:hypothetical protein
LEHAPDELRDDAAVVALAVNESSYLALQFASPKLRGDAALLRAAIQQDGCTSNQKLNMWTRPSPFPPIIPLPFCLVCLNNYTRSRLSN